MVQTGFDPEVHGFAFNNTWNLDVPTLNALRFLTTGSLVLELGLLLTLQASPRELRKPALGAAGLVTLGLLIASRKVESSPFGLCGGMSFAALDYYRSGLALPRSSGTEHPTSQTTDGRTLRSYIWQRTWHSLRVNTLSVLKWMLILHGYPQGKSILHEMTTSEFNKLKTRLDTGAPWPIALIGTTWSIFKNHQVLAIGYEEDRDGGVVYTYDSNCPSATSEIRLRYTQQGLTLSESCPGKRGPLMGFFCEQYTPMQPTAQGIKATNPGIGGGKL